MLLLVLLRTQERRSCMSFVWKRYPANAGSYHPSNVSASISRSVVLLPKSPTIPSRYDNIAAVHITAEAPDSADARWCLGQYFRELAGRFKTGFDPAKSIPANPDELTPPAGVFVVARLGGQPIGCGALKVKDRTIGEVKRMWVAADARGLGVGRRILETLETRARDFGVSTLRLETNRTLKEAQALYRKCGYLEVEPFNDEPYAHHWFEKARI